jgi:hypothetical protein
MKNQPWNPLFIYTPQPEMLVNLRFFLLQPLHFFAKVPPSLPPQYLHILFHLKNNYSGTSPIFRYAAAEGADVSASTTIIIIKSMKMELEIKAGSAGKVHFLVPAGTQIASQQPVAEIK